MKLIEEDARMTGGIRCYGCDFDYTEGYWLEIEGEEPKFFCQECADKAGIVGEPGVYEHTDDGTNTYYLVQMVKGTDNAFDETSEPRTLLITHDKQKAIDYFKTLPEYVDLEEPETDMEGNLKYESPVIIEVSPDGETKLIMS